MTLKLSILDQSPIQEGETATEAFLHTIALVKKAEELGYHRFWVSEHHDLDHVVGSSPEVLIAHLLAKTERIRIGSGGVMLQHYSPYKVAENFHVLASLAPGRVDLGIGRAPGGLPLSTKALQQESTGTNRTLAEKLEELEHFLHDELIPAHSLYGLKVIPTPPVPADLFLLGTSIESAELAASRGIPYVFALFINHDETVSQAAMEAYRKQFRPGRIANPQALLALSVIVADTEEEAAQLAKESKVAKIHLQSGKTVTVTSLKKAEEFGLQSVEPYTIEVKEANVIHGTKDTVREKLIAIQDQYDIEEIIITAPIKDFQKRMLSYERLREAISELTVS
ncbi:LLM class flavin-dependent oxidoreductase [Brevibacillus porteri]|uniref:Alkane 1-monooxygenase n=1 Tax=Brevibacillus porteri TaxID=2126350 RepID=A0ABX5FTV2_9BACL|nr:LLM class flavin-dependent oxidoreductase [Brevibacillus porteri]MED1799279.1 LLM class flavin-dependent oxidoreductase [Brevibacillus porteri]MED2132333.1 LLM class flavin-dependent oxidoreductase [Brevibacillus porteri]MED2744417.1 LLM class flavin-dependent oxidoreductase [Brevibacillus porteri]MED2814861.1 LLM class flavin-dependent oxidoreductase [Brevibacillus porteri]MED2895694.1 LLM class flavin-dependent oxidoreductase [Brevibacillus porteri]